MIRPVFVALALLLAVETAQAADLRKVHDAVVAQDPRNAGISYRLSESRGTLVLDLRDVSGEKSMADVFRILLQTADGLKGEAFKKVDLQFRGKPKFALDGAYFKKMGEEYGWQNPIATTRDFMQEVQKPDGSSAFGPLRGGLMVATGEAMERSKTFHHAWWLDAKLTELK